MSELFSRFEAMEGRARLIAGGAALAVVVLVLMLGRMATSPQMALLYSGLEPSVAAEVLTQLEADQIAHDVRGSSIYVEESARDPLRLRLAGQGLPASGGAGYELLDSLSGFGTTSQMFDAAYRRAQEGEIARTIAAAPAIRSARVHLSRTEESPFRRDQQATASVTVTMANGRLSSERARALRYLVASAVPDLQPDSVSIIDAQAGLIIGDESDDPAQNAGDRAAQMRANILRLLEARVGVGRAFVEVNVDTTLDTETVTERVIDPDSRVAISTDVEEDLEEATGSGASAVTVASNLPDGDAANGGSSTSRELTRTRERVNYEVSEILRERISSPGRVSRLSVAVLVDGITTEGADGPQWAARPQAEIDAMAELVRATVGFDVARGDVLTIESMQFPDRAEAGSIAYAPSLIGGQIPISLLIQLGILSAVVLLLGLFVLRPILTARQQPTMLDTAIELPSPESGPKITPELLLLDNMPTEAEVEVSETPLTKFRGTVDGRKPEAVDLLRSWINADLEEGAST
ncbi:flagellar M-ring protein FliF [Monaibacterium marinum]|uniref:Flagellar M-ring protein n=1 Tax=Pontivivens marinum TaxID=1690039 RepID=A0A2C9CS72_9RHOB|nr:flagellar basal-body MS-ring/collar protein FliF [Monaibacterium marinum]SOH94391.1 flagellar M-ring protein FliF [Monaibacterium marinum]